MIKTWQERCDQHEGIVTNQMIKDRMQEEIDDLKNQLELLAGETVYRGNSVSYIYTKMVAYKKAIGDIWKVLNENGIRANGKTPITEALRQALAQPEQETVAWMQPTTSGTYISETKDEWHTVPVYAAPPKREWVGLTDTERSELANKYKHIETGWYHDMDLIAEAEAKLKEKNT